MAIPKDFLGICTERILRRVFNTIMKKYAYEYNYIDDNGTPINIKHIAQDGEPVKILTKNNEEYIGILLPQYNLIMKNETIVTELFLHRHPDHQGQDFGCTVIKTSDIKSIEKY